MQYLISSDTLHIKTEVQLPASKSISNRVLIINALSFNPYPVANLSDSDDTKVLLDALHSNRNVFDIGHAGTAMRFLTAFLSRIAGTWEVTGSERMKQRPIKILVDALRQLGANIEYSGNDGYPPLKIFGSHLNGKILELDGSISSQYISALLMIAPVIENGLTLKLTGEITSRSYIALTLNLMQKYGIQYTWEDNIITIPEQHYYPVNYTIEADWSAASYWYQLLALANSGELLLRNLPLESLQGDSAIASWFNGFGIHSQTCEDGVLLTKTAQIQPSNLTLNFIENPDIAQTMACLCVAKRIPFLFSGLKTLKIKETDRIQALQNELRKFGAVVHEPESGVLTWDGTIQDSGESIPVIQTYHDHRMALAFAPMALTGKKLVIDNPQVITKSYPEYWQDLSKTGFQISEIHSV